MSGILKIEDFIVIIFRQLHLFFLPKQFQNELCLVERFISLFLLNSTAFEYLINEVLYFNLEMGDGNFPLLIVESDDIVDQLMDIIDLFQSILVMNSALVR